MQQNGELAKTGTRLIEQDAQLQALQVQQGEMLAAVKSKDVKIQALTLELAHIKRIKFGKAPEACSGDQLELCLAHVRRKFFELHAANGSPVAAEALQRIGALYAIERQSASLTPEARLQLRQSLAVPALADLHTWLMGMQPAVAPGSGTAKAIEHALKRWPALERYADSSSFPINNNAVENAIRPIAIGKKNWLFAGSERAGRRAAPIQTLLGTAKLNGLDPLHWLASVLEPLPTYAQTARSICCCHSRTQRSLKSLGYGGSAGRLRAHS
ncbi:IS66 family transposase [Pseudoduganella sp. S-14]|uniref:IS66 family transposase n=1 Tax=Pseudoduganella sp. S-14 TaxID=3404065 RepID=UPI003CE99D46